MKHCPAIFCELICFCGICYNFSALFCKSVLCILYIYELIHPEAIHLAYIKENKLFNIEGSSIQNIEHMVLGANLFQIQ